MVRKPDSDQRDGLAASPRNETRAPGSQRVRHRTAGHDNEPVSLRLKHDLIDRGSSTVETANLVGRATSCDAGGPTPRHEDGYHARSIERPTPTAPRPAYSAPASRATTPGSRPCREPQPTAHSLPRGITRLRSTIVRSDSPNLAAHRPRPKGSRWVAEVGPGGECDHETGLDLDRFGKLGLSQSTRSGA